MCAMMTKLRIWACSTGSGEPNTVPGSGMPVRLLACACALLLVAACQAPIPPTPTTVLPVAPTTVPIVPPTAVPTAVPTVAPTVAPTVVAKPTAVPPAATNTRIETLNAADAAFRGGDLKTAAGLYERVVNTPPNQTEAAAATVAIND